MKVVSIVVVTVLSLNSIGVSSYSHHKIVKEDLPIVPQ